MHRDFWRTEHSPSNRTNPDYVLDSQLKKYAQDNNLYLVALRQLYLGSIPYAHGNPFLFKIHQVETITVRHEANLNWEIYAQLREQPFLLHILSSALTDTFWTLLHWDISPKYYKTEFEILSDVDIPKWEKLALNITIPRDAVDNWIELWKELEKQIYLHAPRKMLAVLLERT